MNFKDHMEHLKTFFTPSVKNVILLIRWLITAIFTGLLVGAVGTLFYYAMSFVTGYRTAHPILIYLLPFAGPAGVTSVSSLIPRLTNSQGSTTAYWSALTLVEPASNATS